MRAVDEMGTIEAGQTLSFGALEVRPLLTPGHTAGMLSFLVAEGPQGSGQAGHDPPPAAAAVFTGDTLFKDSVGGVKPPGTPPTRTCATRSWER